MRQPGEEEFLNEMKKRNYKIELDKEDQRIRQLVFSKDSISIELFWDLMDDASIYLYLGENDIASRKRINFEDILEILGCDSKEFKKCQGGWSSEGFSRIDFNTMFKMILEVMSKIEENLHSIKAQCRLL